MALSIRHQIMDAVIAALKNIVAGTTYQTTVASVSESWIGPDEIPERDMPALFPIDTDERKTPDAIGVGAAADTRSELTILVTAVVHDRYNDTRQKRTDLMRDVEKALVNDTSLKALISSIEPVEVLTDNGSVPNYSIWTQSFKIIYTYNSTNGG